MLKRVFVALVSLLFIGAPRLSAQERGAAALGELVQGLGTTTRVLMIGAHPDDEDTQLIAYLAKGRHVETAYLSLTRGDGGQNLIGNELGEVLGMIRTEELLAARRIDGGRQYFTRAYDFGFSKTIDETYRHWPKDSILKDMVAIVRAFRPQVIISVWSGTPADGHGHHQYSGVVAREVFDAAADTVRFPAAKLGGLPPWTPLKFYRSARRGGGTLTFNVGEYDPLIGRTYSELATESRSQHRSQGQGGLPELGVRLDGVRLEVSRVSDAAAPESGLFTGIDTGWTRFKSLRLVDSARTGLDSLTIAQAAVLQATDLVGPATMVAPLANYVRLAQRAASGIRCTTLEAIGPASPPPCSGAVGDLALALAATRERASAALLLAAGVTVQATAARAIVAEGDSMPISVSVYNEGKIPVMLARAAVVGQPALVPSSPRAILPDSTARETLSYHAGIARSVSWWLRRPRVGDMFVQNATQHDAFVAPEMVMGEDRVQESGVDAEIRIGAVQVPVQTGPIVYRYADPVRGEVRRPIVVVPALTVLLQHEVEYARAEVPFDRTMMVFVHSAATVPREVAVSLVLPEGLRTDSAIRRLTLAPFGDARLYFRVQGRLMTGRHQILANARIGNDIYSLGFVPIEFEHIPPLQYYRPSDVQLQAVNASYGDLRIGYITGVGDNVMPMLEELGLPVTELDPATLPQLNLSKFSAIVVGPRAYEASPALVANNPVLMNYVRNGGTMVTQYGQLRYTEPGILPYPVTLARPVADRVTDEDAPVRVLDPSSRLLLSPNRITDSDFANWVQERASYMPRTFDAAYHPLFSMNDPGEPPNAAAVLVASLGKGTYVYTTLSFFRQLPAGNPGAARLFINLLSADQRAIARPAILPAPVQPEHQ